MIKTYDTREGIAKAVETLEGLNLLVKERHEAGYKQGERMSEWIVLGRLWMDTCGNTMRIVEGVPERLIYELEPVCTMDELKAKTYKNAHVTGASGYAVPHPQATCLHCEVGWTMRDWHDSQFLWNYTTDRLESYHPKCYRYMRDEQEQEFFVEVLNAAEVPVQELRRIPNGYWSREDSTPWFLVTTPWGKIRIGWRKRVICIEWPRMKLAEQPDFSKEDVTKEEHLIHAWGRDKAVSYLKEIFRCVRASQAQ